MSWTIEPHGKGFVLYSGRDDMRHGMNLVYLSEPDANWPKVKAMIEATPELLEACEDAVRFMDEHRMTGGLTYETLQAAIKKARGQ